MKKLLPCPFCGKEAQTKKFRRVDCEFMQQGSIGCPSCGVYMSWSDIRTATRHDTDDEKAVILKWNTRNHRE